MTWNAIAVLVIEGVFDPQLDEAASRQKNLKPEPIA
jgi:hypothetical protein